MTQPPRKLVIIESPFRAKFGSYSEGEAVFYARRAMRDSLLNHNEAPFASHLLYTQTGVLSDGLDSERKLGIEAGFAWKLIVPTIFYTDLGWSDGMLQALDYCTDKGLPYRYRSLEGSGIGSPPPKRNLEPETVVTNTPRAEDLFTIKVLEKLELAIRRLDLNVSEERFLTSLLADEIAKITRGMHR